MRLISELWKDIGVYKGVDYTGMFMISSKGRVKSLNRIITDKRGKKRFVKGRECPIHFDADGYETVPLSKENHSYTAKVHRLVAEYFLLNPRKCSDVNHIDENKANNDINNLEWVTHKENCNKGTRNKRAGEKHRKPVVQLDLNGNFIKEWDCQIETRNAGFSLTCVNNCARGEQETHKGFKWMLLEDYKKLNPNY